MDGSPTITSTDPYAGLALTSPTTSLDADQVYNLHNASPYLLRRIIILSVYCFLVLATTILFVAFRKERAIRAHSVSLTIAQTVTILIGTPLMTMQIGMFGAYPCFFAFLGIYFGLCMWCFCVVARALRLHIIFRFHKEAAVTYLADLDSYQSGKNRDRRVAPVDFGPNALRRTPSGSSYSSASRSLHLNLGVRRRATRGAWAVILGGLIVVTAYVIIILFATDHVKVAEDIFDPQHPMTIVGVPGKTKRGISCTKSDPVWWPAFGFMAAHVLFITPTALYFHWRTNDAYGIRQDLFVTNIFSVPSYIMYFLIATFFWRFNPIFGPNDVIFFIFGVSHIMSVVVPLCRMSLEGYRRRRLKLNVESFQRVVRDPALFMELKNYAVRDFCSEQTLFIEQVHKIKELAASSLAGSESEQAPSSSTPLLQDSRTPIPFELVYHCVSVLDVFIRPGGMMEVNLSANTRQRCIDAIESGRITIGVFDAAYDEVANSLYLNTYPKLLRTLSESKRGLYDGRA